MILLGVKAWEDELLSEILYADYRVEGFSVAIICEESK